MGRPPQERLSLLGELLRHLRLAWRLWTDPRVPAWLKALVPVMVGLYILFPSDLLPDFIPLLGQLDDLVILLLAVKAFIELCPTHLVREHEAAMSSPSSQAGRTEDYIEGSYRVLDEDEE